MVNTRAKASRWRFRFGLRSLFIVICLAAIALSWPGFRMRQTQLQCEASGRITALGGSAVCDVDFDEARRSFMEGRGPGMASFDTLMNSSNADWFANVAAVDLSFIEPPSSTMPPEDMLVISGVETILPITDDNLSCLDGLHYLRWLNLENTRISDAGLQRLGAIDTLEWLNLRNTQVTAESVEKLRRQLRHCNIVHWTCSKG